MDHHSSHHDPATTPRPTQTSFPDSGSYAEDQSELITPTRDTFQPPTNQYSPFNSSAGSNVHGFDHSSNNPPKARVARSGSTKSLPSEVGEGMEVEESDDDSTAGDGDRLQKKKKGQRFFCTDYPPCNLSFTRSEHLARHIRKHTGERPFQCHCLRRFSRLDNLRQHAQTVHLNEDIPQGSLAATGTRFQRQIRTDRVRPPGSRARASTISGQANFQRGHSRNISSSSIGSTSDFGTSDDFRSRQQQQHHHHQHQRHHLQQQQQQQQQQQHNPIHIPQTTPVRMGLTVDTFGAGDAGPDHPYYPYFVQNTNGYSSPTPVFAADPHSPVAHAGLQSPIAMAPRGMTWAEPMHSRRMSVPSDSATFQSPSSYGSAMSYMSPLTSSNASIYSNASSMITSPTSSTFSDPYQDHITEAEMRRRTWHPGTYGTFGPRPATSGLSYHQTPDAPKPVPTTQSAAAQNVRLPGIDSFDHGNHKPATRLLRPLSPMEMDASPRHTQADLQNLDGPSTPTHRPLRSLHVATQSAPQSLETAAREISAAALTNAAVTPRRQKREAWYNGPLPKDRQQPQPRTSPGGSSSDGPRTPSTPSISEYHPAIAPSNDFAGSPSHILGNESSKINDAMMSEHTLQASPTHIAHRRNGDMDRLDALVAVATSESQATSHY